MRSVSDFLAAGRTGGRYLISLSQGTASLGAFTIVGMLEMNDITGFNMRRSGSIMGRPALPRPGPDDRRRIARGM